LTPQEQEQEQAQMVKLNQEYQKKKEAIRKREIALRTFEIIQQTKALKEQEINQNESEKIKNMEHKITKGSQEMAYFKQNSAGTAKNLSYASLASIPWTSKQSLLKSNILSEHSGIGKHLYNMSDSTPALNFLNRHGMYNQFTGGLTNSAYLAKNLGNMALPAGAALSLGLNSARQSREIRSFREDRKKLGTSANVAEKSGMLADVIKTSTLSPILGLKALRGLPLIGGMSGAAGDFGARMVSKIPRMIGSTMMGGGAAATGALPAILGGFMLALPRIISGVAGAKAEIARKKLIAVRSNPFKFVREYSQAHFIDNVLPKLINANQINAADQVKIALLRLIADSVSPIPKMTEILNYQEEQREKEVSASKKSIRKFSQPYTEDTIKDKIGKGFDKLSIKAQKFTSVDPIRQIFTYLFEHKTPLEIKQELNDALDKNEREDHNKKVLSLLSEKTGLSYHFLTLLNTPSKRLLSMSSGPESTQTFLLSGIYDIMRGYVTKWLEDKEEIGKHGLKIQSPEGTNEQENWYDYIPGLSGLVDTFKFIKNLDITKLGTGIISTGAKKMFGSDVSMTDPFNEYIDAKKEKWSGRFNKYVKDPLKKWGFGEFDEYKKDPDKIMKELGLFQTQEEKIKQYQETGLPDDIQTIIYYMKEQLNTLENSFQVNKTLLNKLTGESYEKQSIVDTRKKQFDFVTGESFNEDDFDKIKEHRKQKVSDELYEKTKPNKDYTSKAFSKIKESGKIFAGVGAGSGLLFSALFGINPLLALALGAAGGLYGAGSEASEQIQNAPVGNRLNFFEKFKRMKNLRPRDDNRRNVKNINAVASSDVLGRDKIEGLTGSKTMVDDLFQDEAFKSEEKPQFISTVAEPKSESPIKLFQQEQLKFFKESVEYFKTSTGFLKDIKDLLISIETSILGQNSFFPKLVEEYASISSEQQKHTSILESIDLHVLSIFNKLSTLSKPEPQFPKFPTISEDSPKPLMPGKRYAKDYDSDGGDDSSDPISKEKTSNVFNIFDYMRKPKKEEPEPEPEPTILKTLTGRAKGGPTDKDEPFIVGEEGPEVATFDKKATIFSMLKSQKIIIAEIIKDIFKLFKRGVEDTFEEQQLPPKIVTSNQLLIGHNGLEDPEKSPNVNRSATMELTELEKEKKEEKQENFMESITDPKKGQLPEIVNLLKNIEKNKSLFPGKGGDSEGGGGFLSSLLGGTLSSFLLKILPVIIPAILAILFGATIVPLLRKGIASLLGGSDGEPTPVSDFATKSTLTGANYGIKAGTKAGIEALSKPTGAAAKAGAEGLSSAASKGAGGLAGTLAEDAAKVGTEGLSSIGGKVAEEAAEAGSKTLGEAAKAGLKTAAKGTVKAGLSTVAKAAPIVGIGTGLYFGYERLAEGDPWGAALEVTSGLLGGLNLGGAGTIGSLGISGYLLHRDLAKQQEELEKSFSPEVKKLVDGDLERFLKLRDDKSIIYDDHTKMWIINNPSMVRFKINEDGTSTQIPVGSDPKDKKSGVNSSPTPPVDKSQSETPKPIPPPSPTPSPTPPVNTKDAKDAKDASISSSTIPSPPKTVPKSEKVDPAKSEKLKQLKQAFGQELDIVNNEISILDSKIKPINEETKDDKENNDLISKRDQLVKRKSKLEESIYKIDTYDPSKPLPPKQTLTNDDLEAKYSHIKNKNERDRLISIERIKTGTPGPGFKSLVSDELKEYTGKGGLDISSNKIAQFLDIEPSKIDNFFKDINDKTKVGDSAKNLGKTLRETGSNIYQSGKEIVTSDDAKKLATDTVTGIGKGTSWVMDKTSDALKSDTAKDIGSGVSGGVKWGVNQLSKTPERIDDFLHSPIKDDGIIETHLPEKYTSTQTKVTPSTTKVTPSPTPPTETTKVTPSPTPPTETTKTIKDSAKNLGRVVRETGSNLYQSGKEIVTSDDSKKLATELGQGAAHVMDKTAQMIESDSSKNIGRGIGKGVQWGVTELSKTPERVDEFLFTPPKQSDVKPTPPPVIEMNKKEDESLFKKLIGGIGSLFSPREAAAADLPPILDDERDSKILKRPAEISDLYDLIAGERKGYDIFKGYKKPTDNQPSPLNQISKKQPQQSINQIETQDEKNSGYKEEYTFFEKASDTITGGIKSGINAIGDFFTGSKSSSDSSGKSSEIKSSTSSPTTGSGSSSKSASIKTASTKSSSKSTSDQSSPSGGSLKLSNTDDVKNMIKRHEGYRPKPYRDADGYSVGYGHWLGKTLTPEMNREYSKQEVEQLFEKDFAEHAQAATGIPGFNKLDSSGKGALIDMTFNMGKAWYKEWPNLRKSLEAGNAQGVIKSLENSKWYRQVYPRSKEIASILSNSITNPSEDTSSVTASASPPVSSETAKSADAKTTTTTTATTTASASPPVSSETSKSKSTDTVNQPMINEKVKQPLEHNYGKLNSKTVKDEEEKPSSEYASKSRTSKISTSTPIADDILKTGTGNQLNTIPINSNNSISVNSTRSPGTSDGVNSIIDDIFPNSISLMIASINNFAIGQSPYPTLR